MDVDFSPPNTDAYPVRPFWYLLDPQTRDQLKSANSHDVTIRGAIVILGDNIIDVYSTPSTSVGTDLMSGTEILAHSIDTISRHSWPQRLTNTQQYLYIF